ncbi:MAG: CBS domain-containing protein [Promethearchaeota archaeon]
MDRLEQFSQLQVNEVMIKNPVFITPDEKISVTELIMLRKNIGGLPVVKNSKKKELIGIITQRDIRLARFAMSLEAPNTKVKDLMTSEPFVVKIKDKIIRVLEIMLEKNIQRLPVVNENNELIGLVLRNEILKTLFKYMKK